MLHIAFYKLRVVVVVLQNRGNAIGYRMVRLARADVEGEEEVDGGKNEEVKIAPKETTDSDSSSSYFPGVGFVQFRGRRRWGWEVWLDEFYPLLRRQELVADPFILAVHIKVLRFEWHVVVVALVEKDPDRLGVSPVFVVVVSTFGFLLGGGEYILF